MFLYQYWSASLRLLFSIFQTLPPPTRILQENSIGKHDTDLYMLFYYTDLLLLASVFIYTFIILRHNVTDAIIHNTRKIY